MYVWLWILAFVPINIKSSFFRYVLRCVLALQKFFVQMRFDFSCIICIFDKKIDMLPKIPEVFFMKSHSN